MQREIVRIRHSFTTAGSFLEHSGEGGAIDSPGDFPAVFSDGLSRTFFLEIFTRGVADTVLVNGITITSILLQVIVKT